MLNCNTYRKFLLEMHHEILDIDAYITIRPTASAKMFVLSVCFVCHDTQFYAK